MKKLDLLCLVPLSLLTSCGTQIIAAPAVTGAASKYSVQLTWDQPAGNDPIVSYNVYREQAAEAVGFAQINNAPVVTVTYTDRNVQLGASYAYVVRAMDAAGEESPLSNTATVTIPSQ